MLIADLEPGQSSFGQPDVHLGEECRYVLTGRLTATIGGQTTAPDEGGTPYFDARVPRHFRNDGEEEVQVLVALLYPPGPPRLAASGDRTNGRVESLARRCPWIAGQRMVVARTRSDVGALPTPRRHQG